MKMKFIFPWLMVVFCPAIGAADKIIVERVSAELPPGFDVQGPDKFWSCRGTDGSRARFLVLDREKMHQQLSRVMPQFAKNLSDTYDDEENKAMAAADTDKVLAIQKMREPVENELEANLPQFQAGIDDIRNRDLPPQLMASFAGSMNGEDCEMSLVAELKSSHDAQIVSNVPDETKFSVGVSLAKETMQIPFGGAMMTVQIPGPWQACDRQYRHNGRSMPCPPGEMVLEHLRVNHISGSFRFPVKREVNDNHEVTRFVAGHFNATSEQTEDSDTFLDYLSRGSSFGPARITQDGLTTGESLGRLAMPGKLIPAEPRKKIAPD